MKAMKKGKMVVVGPLRQGRVLIAGDIPPDLQDAILRHGGLAVEFARPGRETIQKAGLAATGGDRYDLVLINFDEPSTGGREMCLSLRNLTGYEDVTILAFTASVKTVRIAEYINKGVNDVIRLPLDKGRLHRLTGWLNKAQKNGSSGGRPMDSNKTGDALYGVDVQTGLSHMGGNKELYRELLQKFSANHAQFEDRLKEALKTGAAADAGRMIHTLKGLAGSFGMNRLRALSEQAEEQIRRDALTGSEEGLQSLTDELMKVIDGIRRRIPVADAPTLEKHSTLSPHKLNALEKCLNEHDPEAIHRVKEIGTVMGYEQQLERLRRAVAAYEFESALEVLKKMRVDGALSPPRRS